MDNSVDGIPVKIGSAGFTGEKWGFEIYAGFVLMPDIRGINPFEVGNEGSIDWSKGFVGKAALEKIRDKGVRRKLIGYTVADPDALIAGQSMLSSQALMSSRMARTLASAPSSRMTLPWEPASATRSLT